MDDEIASKQGSSLAYAITSLGWAVLWSVFYWTDFVGPAALLGALYAPVAWHIADVFWWPIRKRRFGH